jgi:hypothetical protein
MPTQYVDFESHSRRFMSALLAYLTNASVAAADDEGEAALPDESNSDGKSRCLICKKLFHERSALKKHSNAKHIKETTFRDRSSGATTLRAFMGKRMRRTGSPKQRSMFAASVKRALLLNPGLLAI